MTRWSKISKAANILLSAAILTLMVTYVPGAGMDKEFEEMAKSRKEFWERNDASMRETRRCFDALRAQVEADRKESLRRDKEFEEAFRRGWKALEENLTNKNLSSEEKRKNRLLARRIVDEGISKGKRGIEESRISLQNSIEKASQFVDDALGDSYQLVEESRISLEEEFEAAKERHKEIISSAKKREFEKAIELSESPLKMAPKKKRSGPSGVLPSRKTCQLAAPGLVEKETGSLYVLVSTSVPKKSVVHLCRVAQLVGGRLVLRGAPEGDFSSLAEWVNDLRDEGVFCDMEINPKIFEEHSVNNVPYILLQDGEKKDSVSGNVSVEYALDLFSSSGQTKELAEKMRKKLRGRGG